MCVAGRSKIVPISIEIVRDFRDAEEAPPDCAAGVLEEYISQWRANHYYFEHLQYLWLPTIFSLVVYVHSSNSNMQFKNNIKYYDHNEFNQHQIKQTRRCLHDKTNTRIQNIAIVAYAYKFVIHKQTKTIQLFNKVNIKSVMHFIKKLIIH